MSCHKTLDCMRFSIRCPLFYLTVSVIYCKQCIPDTLSIRINLQYLYAGLLINHNQVAIFVKLSACYFDRTCVIIFNCKNDWICLCISVRNLGFFKDIGLTGNKLTGYCMICFSFCFPCVNNITLFFILILIKG